MLAAVEAAGAEDVTLAAVEAVVAEDVMLAAVEAVGAGAAGSVAAGEAAGDAADCASGSDATCTASSEDTGMCNWVNQDSGVFPTVFVRFDREVALSSCSAPRFLEWEEVA